MYLRNAFYVILLNPPFKRVPILDRCHREFMNNFTLSCVQLILIRSDNTGAISNTIWYMANRIIS
jgi:hypothetical protein